MDGASFEVSREIDAVNNFLHVMSIDFFYIPTKGFPFPQEYQTCAFVLHKNHRFEFDSYRVSLSNFQGS